VSLWIDSFNFSNLDEAALRRSVTVDILLPAALAGPLLFMLLRKVRQLAIAHAEMSKLASTDSLTAVLNRGAFSMLVEAYLADVHKGTLPTTGSLLVIDADHFKTINDRFGHQAGDAALRLIASSIQGVLRTVDLVGRIGGEEFGVFLPGTTRSDAVQVAERIRAMIEATPFPEPGSRSLSVSIGGVCFRTPVVYYNLFAVADRCLYEAKERGRNQVHILDYVANGRAIGHL
jgi:diguanylate cyclase (GGDEF)-like protein